MARERMVDLSLRVDADGPGGVPLVNNLRFLTQPHTYVLDRMASHRDRPVVPVTARNGSIAVVFGESAVRQFFTDNESFHRPGDSVFRLPAGQPWSRMYEAVLTANGDEHRRRRRLLLPSMHRNVLETYRAVFTETFARSRFATADDDEPFDVVAEFRTITKINMMRCLLGLDETPRNLALADEILALLDLSTRPDVQLVRWNRPWMPYGRWVRSVASAYEGLAGLIEERRTRPDGPDALSIICATTDEDGTRLSTPEIVGELHSLFAAGFATTALTMLWALVTTLGSPGEPGAADVSDVDAVVKESQRLLPAVAMSLPRRVVREATIGGTTLPAGALLFTAPFAEHHDPAVFADPSAFRPERWLSGPQPTPFQFLPFGVGARRCLGAAFADLQARVTLALIAEGPRRPRLLTTTIDYHMKAGVSGSPRGPVLVALGRKTVPAKLTGSVTRLWTN